MQGKSLIYYTFLVVLPKTFLLMDDRQLMVLLQIVRLVVPTELTENTEAYGRFRNPQSV